MLPDWFLVIAFIQTFESFSIVYFVQEPGTFFMVGNNWKEISSCILNK